MELFGKYRPYSNYVAANVLRKKKLEAKLYCINARTLEK